MNKYNIFLKFLQVTKFYVRSYQEVGKDVVENNTLETEKGIVCLLFLWCAL